MSARKQLNTIYTYGILLLAAAVAVAFGSWALFAIAVPLMLGIALADGSIRISSNRRSNNHRKRR